MSSKITEDTSQLPWDPFDDMIYQMKNVIQMSTEVTVGAAQSAINNMDKK